MTQWINALKAPLTGTDSIPEADKPTAGQIAVVWAGLGVLIARIL